MNFKFIFLVFIFTLQISISKEYRWVKVDEMPDNVTSDYQCLFVKDEQNIIFGGSRNFHYPMTRFTTNGGKSWDFGFVDSSFIPFFHAKPVKIREVFWGEGNNVIAFADSGYYYKTNDLKNWEKKQLPIEQIALFQDADIINNYIVVYYATKVYKSTDFGANWELIYSYSNNIEKLYFSRLKLITDNIFYFSSFLANNSQEFTFAKFITNKWEYKSTSNVFINNIDIFLNKLFFERSNVDNYNNLYKSINEGETWEIVYQIDFNKHNLWRSPNLYKDSIFTFSENYNHIFKVYDNFKRTVIDSSYSKITNWAIVKLQNITFDKMILSNDQTHIYIYTDEDLGTSVEDISENHKNEPFTLIFPNPSSDKISLDLGGVAFADLVVYDIFGNEIMSIPNYSNKSEIDISNLSIGTYKIQLQTSTGIIIQRFVKY